jgi:hypothetical protein
VDYRELNAAIIKNQHLLPLIGETLDRLVGTKMFTKLDLKNIYHHIYIKKNNEWKTVFRTRYDHYKYNILSFRLVNIPAIFQAYINRIFEGLFDNFYIIYFNNILIYSEFLKEYSRHVREILARLR